MYRIAVEYRLLGATAQAFITTLKLLFRQFCIADGRQNTTGSGFRRQASTLISIASVSMFIRSCFHHPQRNTTQSYYNNHSSLIISLFINTAIINNKHDAMNTTNRQQVSAAIYSLSAEHSNLIRKTTVETSAASATCLIN